MGLDLDPEKNTTVEVGSWTSSDSAPYSDDSGSSSSLKELSSTQKSEVYYMDDESCNAKRDPSRVALLSSHGIATSSNEDVLSRVHAVSPFSGSDSRITKAKPLHPTAYLDGLRGVAAFIVFIHHFTLFSFLGGTQGYNSDNTASTRWFFQLPIVCLVHSGRPMVAIFFIISGFVLSYKPLQLMRSGSYGILFTNLSSSVFRRPIRLFLPLILPTFISIFLIQAGAWKYWIFAAPDLNSQLWHWIRTLMQMISPFHWDMGHPDYDDHLWTIPVEFRGSLVVFITLLGLGTTKPALRMTLVSLIAFMAFWKTRWECTLFLAGIVLAEWSLIRADNSPTLPISLPTSKLTWTLPRLSARSIHIIKIANLIVALFFLSVTSLGSKEKRIVKPLFYRVLEAGIPFHYERWDLVEWWYVVPAAILLLISFVTFPITQRPFTTPIAQYLGKISYALYIVHGPIFRTLYAPVVNGAWMMLGVWDTSFPPAMPSSNSPVQPPNSGRVGFLAYISGPILGACVLMPATMGLAHVFWKFVDLPSVAAARKIAKWATDS